MARWDDKIFENELIELADYIIENELYNDYSVRFFDFNIGFPLTEKYKDSNYCGAGHMLTIDYKGDIYPCIRYTSFTLNNTDGYKIGNIETGINYDLIRPFENLTLRVQSEEECINCEVATGCSWCSGFNYDDANGVTLFHRAINNCLMHKANVRAVEYFWDKLTVKLNIENPRIVNRKIHNQNAEAIKFMLIITSDNITPHCCYQNIKNLDRLMSQEIFNEAIELCKEEGFEPIILGDGFYSDKYKNYMHIGISEYDDIIIHDELINESSSRNNIVLTSTKSINNLFAIVNKLLNKEITRRINIIIKDLDEWDDNTLQSYKYQMELISEKLYKIFLNHKPISINVLTDIFENTCISDCGSGINSFAVAPNGKIYLCPAFYFNNVNDTIGDLKNGIRIEREKLLHVENSKICSNCDSYQCKRCLYLNKKMTTEINTPPKIQCVVSHIERSISRDLELKLIKNDLLDPLNFINKIHYLDPLDKIKNTERIDYEEDYNCRE